jgi:hypothetical protein
MDARVSIEVAYNARWLEAFHAVAEPVGAGMGCSNVGILVPSGSIRRELL